jgi:hypothetical protein
MCRVQNVRSSAERHNSQLFHSMCVESLRAAIFEHRYKNQHEKLLLSDSSNVMHIRTFTHVLTSVALGIENARVVAVRVVGRACDRVTVHRASQGVVVRWFDVLGAQRRGRVSVEHTQRIKRKKISCQALGIRVNNGMCSAHHGVDECLINSVTYVEKRKKYYIRC